MSGMAPSRINCFGVMSNEALAWAGGVRRPSKPGGAHRNHKVDANEELSRYG